MWRQLISKYVKFKCYWCGRRWHVNRRRWYVNDQYHRDDDGPAVVDIYDDYRSWWKFVRLFDGAEADR